MSLKTNVPKLRGIVVGEYGKSITLTLKDFDGNLQDISSYSTINILSRSPDAKKTITSTGAFTTDGTDGSIYWAYASSDCPDRDGIWELQVKLTKTGALAKSYPAEMEVEGSLG